MIFMSVLLPAPFSPTRPWISPARNGKSTSRSEWTTPNGFEMPTISSSAGLPFSTCKCLKSLDEEVVFHPEHAFGVRPGDHRAVGHDVPRDALAGRFTTGFRRHTGHDSA